MTLHQEGHTQDVIAVLVRYQHALKLLWRTANAAQAFQQDAGGETGVEE
jgi:hypothetical protein